MPKPRRLSGADIIRILGTFGFSIEGQRGSHVKLVRHGTNGKQVLLISNHIELKTGTTVGIYKQALRYISESELRIYFYTE